MKKTLITRITVVLGLILVGLLFPSFAAGTKEKPVITVLNLEGKNVPDADVDTVSDFLRTDLANTGKFTVAERARMSDVLKEQQLGQTGLGDNETAIKIGKLLNSKFIVVGTISKLDAKFFINVRVINVETGETVLAKRENSDSVSGLSQISKNIALSLARGEKDTDITSDSRYPVMGVDIYWGPYFGVRHNYSYDKLDRSLRISSPGSLSDFRVGGYFMNTYLGYFRRSMEVKAGTSTDVTERSNVLEKTYSGSFASALNMTSSDFVIGYRSNPKGQLSPSVAYFAWKSLSINNGTLSDSFYGPAIGGFNRKSIVLPNSPVSIVYCINTHVGYMFYKKPSGYSSTSSPFGISYSAEAGLGMQFDKAGLYVMMTYAVEGLWLLDSSSLSADNMSNYLMRGIQIKLGYNFDLPTLFK